MFKVLQRRNFGLLFSGQLVSQIGDYVLFVGLPFYIYQLTGSATATGVMFAALTIPQLFLSPFAGVFVDRWNRRATMIVADFLRAAIVLGFLTVHMASQAWIIYLLAFGESAVSRFFYPARDAILPLVVDRDDLAQANAAIGVSDAIARLGGPALGGLLVATWGINGAALFDAFSYLFSGVSILLMSIPVLKRVDVEGKSWINGMLGIGQDMLEGLSVVVRRPVLRTVFLVMGAFMLSQGIINVLLVVLVNRIWGGGATEFGWLISGQGVGALAGSVILGNLAQRLTPRQMMMLGAIGGGILLLLMVNQPSIVVAVGLLVVAGMLLVGLFVGINTTMQLGSDDHNRGRVSSLLSTLMAAAMLLSIGVTSAVAETVGPVLMLDIAAGCMILAGGVALIGVAGKPNFVTVEPSEPPAQEQAV